MASISMPALPRTDVEGLPLGLTRITPHPDDENGEVLCGAWNVVGASVQVRRLKGWQGSQLLLRALLSDSTHLREKQTRGRQTEKAPDRVQHSPFP